MYAMVEDSEEEEKVVPPRGPSSAKKKSTGGFKVSTLMTREKELSLVASRYFPF